MSVVSEREPHADSNTKLCTMSVFTVYAFYTPKPIHPSWFLSTRAQLTKAQFNVYFATESTLK